jgi:hypothetical protein
MTGWNISIYFTWWLGEISVFILLDDWVKYQYLFYLMTGWNISIHFTWWLGEISVFILLDLLSVNFYILIFFSETTGPIRTKLGRNVHWMNLKKLRIFFLGGGVMIGSTQKKKEAQKYQKGCLFFIIFPETARPIGTKLYMNVHWMVL